MIVLFVLISCIFFLFCFMVASVYIHGSRGIVGFRYVCFVGKFMSLSSLLHSFHGESLP
jgi:hypothetical protein